MSKIGKGYGYGKIILFNEHFVVYGIPAIACAIRKKTTAIVEKSDKGGFVLNDNRLETPGYKKNKLEHHKDSLNRIFKKMDIKNINELKVTMEGDLVASSGIGASAASCSALARAISDYYDLDYSDEMINEVAYEGEKGYHGTPSGIDNTAATFGGLIWFKKGTTNIIEKMKIEKPLDIVIGNTGVVANTTKAVAGVRERKEKFPEKYNKIFNEAEKCANDAKKALNSSDIEKIGKLMNKNHQLLQEIEVSSKDLDFLVNLALDNGAIGAKLTGGGLGGNMIALTPGKELQERVSNAISKEGFKTNLTSMG